MTSVESVTIRGAHRHWGGELFKSVIGNAAGGNKVCTYLLRTMGPHGRVRVEEGAKQPDEKSGRKSAG